MKIVFGEMIMKSSVMSLYFDNSVTYSNLPIITTSDRTLVMQVSRIVWINPGLHLVDTNRVLVNLHNFLLITFMWRLFLMVIICRSNLWLASPLPAPLTQKEMNNRIRNALSSLVEPQFKHIQFVERSCRSESFSNYQTLQSQVSAPSMSKKSTEKQRHDYSTKVSITMFLVSIFFRILHIREILSLFMRMQNAVHFDW